MPLFVEILRHVVLFQNTFDTFKTLKLPTPSRSSRNGRLPSARAMQQRKREMKGCLAVWIVWCCFMAYERLLEGIFSLFIPFYDEVKALTLLFLLVTRAKGAEPIYLHVIRPLLKPYTASVDALLDLARMFGDIIFVLSAFPMRYIHTWWCYIRSSSLGQYFDVRRQVHSKPRDRAAATTSSMRRTSSSTSTLVDVNISHATTAADPSRILKESVGQKVNAGPRPDFALDPTVKASVASVASHQIWYPPPSSYRDSTEENVTPETTSDVNRHDGLPDMISEYTVQELMQMEEWRQYPAFPSAYPATPLLPTNTLPNISAVMLSFADNEGDRTVRQQDFEQSLLISRASMESNLAELLSDNTDQNQGEDDEDDFNITLGTPLPPPTNTFRSRPRRRPIRPLVFESDGDVSSGATSPTALSTTDNGSSLHTPTSSEASFSESLPQQAPPVASKKRALPRSFSPRIEKKTRTRASPISRRTVQRRDIVIQPRRRVVVARRRQTLKPAPASEHEPSEGNSAASEREGSLNGNATRPKLKRRKVDSSSTKITSQRKGKGTAPPRFSTIRSSSRLRAGAASGSELSDNHFNSASQETLRGRRSAAR
ncbi:hypothetical protein IW261DRAFT_1602209 [Armillaria novae-zelandiae]|uniref:Protein YOP1 n=1 Tax=Armillaria novae-zelandiae TaxID=153914 RepID=A0AA39PVU6_9AGAR|nr:hypothetical protein IW261DRAFT_1602209 [Armillaria novae-zelandiae]